MSVIIRIGNGIVTNDRVHPPQPLLFEMEEFQPGLYYLRCLNVSSFPYLGYSSSQQKFSLNENRIVVSSNLQSHYSQIYRSEIVQLENQDGSLGNWYLYVDSCQPEETQTKIFPLLLFLFLLILLIIGSILVRSSDFGENFFP